MIMMKRITFFLLLLFSATIAFGQQIEKEKVHSPGRAALKSAIIPGWGQAYNKKYWKIPIIYGGIGGLAYLIDYNASNYNDFKSAYVARTDGDSTTTDIYEGLYSEDQLLTIIDFYRKNLDFSVVGAVLLYVANIVDATVDAHLMDFKISDDLSLHIEPRVIFAGSRATTGFGLTLNL
jgi:hypothetical protein